MNWRDVWVFYRFELRGALRERTIVLNSLLMPLLLYPGMIFLGLTGVSIYQSQTEGFVSRIALGPVPVEHLPLKERLEDEENLELTSIPDDFEAALRRGELDVVVELVEVAGGGAELAENFRLRATIDGSRERSTTAWRRIERLAKEYREGWLEDRAELLGVGGPEVEIFALEERDRASSRQLGAFLLGLLLPLTFVIMVAVGAFNPAIDATAGERERQTWETTLTLATARSNLVVAKYLFVTTLGAVAGLLNVAALTVSMRSLVSGLFGLGEEGVEFAIPLAAWPVLVVCAALLAGVVGALMMLFAAFARNFKEGQSMVMPVYLLSFLPAMLLNDPGLELELKYALLPIGNVILVVREVVSGHFLWPEMAASAAVQLTVIALCLWLATVILRFEDVLVGSYSGNLFQFARRRLLRRSSAKRASKEPR